MKRSVSLFLLFCSVSIGFAQSKGELGVYGEGGLFMPTEATLVPSKSNGLVVGAGTYYSKPILENFAVSLGLGYRYKENGKKTWMPDLDQMELPGDFYSGGYGGYGYSPYGYSPYGSGGYGYRYPGETISPEDYVLTRQKITIPQKSLIVPLKFKYVVEKAFFIETGIEAEWLLNYSTVSRRPDFSWLLSFGYKKQDLQLSLSYVQGFEDQYMGESTVGNWLTSQTVKNRMLLLNISYPLWKR